ncbi:MAG: hypothetical protein D6693_09400 [Planctomycetota bacterium]|nr:MAG: hypothetical protein D6693_09400 [Planctomycetota bacterium]
MMVRHSAGIAVAALIIARPACAAFEAGSMHEVADLAPFTNLVASLDVASTPFNFPFDSALFTNSGFVRNVLDANGNPIAELDRTELRTDVYRVNQQTQLAPGGLTLEVGDMVFAYTIRLVSASGNTVSAVDEVQVAGANFLGTDSMDLGLLKARGFLTPSPGVVAPISSVSPAVPDDFSLFGLDGGQLEWNWFQSDPTQQLGNSETITLLMFTGQASIGSGFMNLAATLASSTGPFDPTVEAAPVLIPISFVVPTPGAATLVGLACLTALRRRR